MLLMGIDVGTTGVKVAIFDEDAKMHGYGFREYPILHGENGRAEQDAEYVWQCTQAAMTQAVGACSGAVDAVSVSVQGDAVIPVDADGNAIGPAQLGMDYRGVSQAEALSRQFGASALFSKTGMRPHPMNSVVKMMWLAQNQPDVLERAHKLVTYADFILKKLGSDGFYMDDSMASRTMALDIRTGQWDFDILKAAGVPAEKLSTVVPSGTVVGRMGAGVAKAAGIAGTPLLCAGGHDQTCAALGAGVVEEGLALDSHGTAEVLGCALNSLRVDQGLYEGYYPCYRHTVSGQYFTFSLNHTGGLLLRWYRDNLALWETQEAAHTGGDAFSIIMDSLPAGPSGLLILPHFDGSGTPVCDLESKGAILGLSMRTTRQDIAKALLEALSLELRLNMETLFKCGIRVQSLRCVGGGARTPAGLQLKADITGMPVATLRVREAACLGAAILAGIGAGAYDDARCAIDLVATEHVYEPDPAMHRLYEEQYGVYRNLYETLKPILHQL